MNHQVGEVAARRNGWTSGRVHDGQAAERLRLRDLVEEDLATHEGKLSSAGFLALLLHRVGTRVRARAPSRFRVALDGVHDVLATGVERASGIYLPLSTRVGRRVHIRSRGATSLHACSIGDDVELGPGTRLGPLCHPSPGCEDLPTLEDGVCIEEGASILGSVTVGRGAHIGAHAVVLTSVAAGADVRALPSPKH